jgi:hypothetical protein
MLVFGQQRSFHFAASLVMRDWIAARSTVQRHRITGDAAKWIDHSKKFSKPNRWRLDFKNPMANYYPTPGQVVHRAQPPRGVEQGLVCIQQASGFTSNKHNRK